MPISKFPPVACLHLVLALALIAITPLAHAQAPAQLPDRYRAQTGAPSGPSRDQKFFTSKHGREWSCALCHGNPSAQTGRHAATGKSATPLAPTFNPERLTDTAEMEKWFRHNCSDVVRCEYTVVEKADVLSWLMILGKQGHPVTHSTPDLMWSLQMSGHFVATTRVVCTRLVVAGLGSSFLAVAEEGPGVRVASLLPKYRQKYASCHIVYSPGALPTSSWQCILDNLQHHHGTDTSLDPTTVRQLDQWLTTNVADRPGPMPPPSEDRITRSVWFARTHDGVPTTVWHQPAVKNASNCAVCHTKADQGDFNGYNVRIPR